MRSLLVLALSAAAFGWLLYDTNTRGARVLEHDEQVLAEFRTWLRDRPAGPREHDGYRFERRAGDGLPTVWLASPLQARESGVRWYLSAGGRDVYEFDTVLIKAPGDQPDVHAMRAWLAIPDARRETAARPYGWELAGKLRR